jgi:hypothetical protein
MPRTFARTIPCLVGAAAGGALGYLTFHWGLGQGFYALMLPGASLGLGCYGLSRHPSRPRGVTCGLTALALGLVSEWSASPFLVDGGLAYFLAHVHHLRAITLIMIAAGGVVAFLLGQDHYLPAGKAAGPEV